MDRSAGSSTSQKVGTIRKRSEKEKAKRRNREKVSHSCPLCDHTPFKSISGLRAHVIGVHQKHCSWTKRISDLKPADVTEASRPVLGVDNIEVRVLHLAGSSSVEISDGCDINNGEQSVIIDPAFVESLEAFFDGLPLAEYPDDDVEPVVAGPCTMSSQVVVNNVSTGTLTDAYGLPHVHSRAVQTPRSAELYLPVSINRLIRLVRESNGSSVADMLRHLGMDHGGFRTDEIQILTLVLDAMVEARRDLIRSVIAGYEEATEAEKAAPHVGGLQKMADLTSRIDAEFRRLRPNPWPKTTAEVDEELIHIVTPGTAAAIAAENAAAVTDAELEVTLIDSD